MKFQFDLKQQLPQQEIQKLLKENQIYYYKIPIFVIEVKLFQLLLPPQELILPLVVEKEIIQHLIYFFIKFFFIRDLFFFFLANFDLLNE